MTALEALAQFPDDFRCVSLETVFERTTKHAGERAPQQIELRAVEIHQVRCSIRRFRHDHREAQRSFGVVRGEDLLPSDYDGRQVEARFRVSDADMGDADYRLAAAVLLLRPIEE